VFYNLFGISTIKKLKFEIFHLDNGEITSSNILGDYSFVQMTNYEFKRNF